MHGPTKCSRSTMYCFIIFKILCDFRLADDLEDIYSAPNLLNVLLGSIEICALGFNLTVRINIVYFLSRFVRMIIQKYFS